MVRLWSLADGTLDQELPGHDKHIYRILFDPTGRYLFVNVQTPGITFAITGPWAKGPL